MESSSKPLSTFLFVMEITVEKWSHRGWFLVVQMFIIKACGSGLPDWQGFLAIFCKPLLTTDGPFALWPAWMQ
jgi:hypothetical protein